LVLSDSTADPLLVVSLVWELLPATFVEDTHERAAARRRSVSFAALAEMEHRKPMDTGAGPTLIVSANFQHLQ
jgi:hypothetical protein